ncbi:GlcG/HbpS family heme-binding protein [Burkholderia sp. Ac-20379]|uniref:GlcG/HbpS family heme-binding protein n=1 Tax=Burkholderia sp. Ac-20379 TaxID=2703900 RepID=UPI00198129B0|nr:heme-binding protein [Burkholderia sp. Ac-20379]MBN3724627.1 heme-binding protein [Burkholderia sp. Ac-20379]
MKPIHALLVSLVSPAAFAAGPADKLPTQHVLTLSSARYLADIAEQKIASLGTTGTVTIADADGVPILTERLDGTFAASSRLAPAKALTAAQFRVPTAKLEKIINDGRTAAVTSTYTAMAGGEPIVVDGQVIGGIGISTAVPPDDAKVAEETAAAFR